MGHYDQASEHHLYDSGSRVASVVTRTVVDRSITVSRAIAEQPVHPYLVEVRVGVTRIYLDPAKEYRRQNENAIDDNHTILKALRLADSMHAQRARIVRRQPRHKADHGHHVVADANEVAPQQAPESKPVQQQESPEGDVGVLAMAAEK